MPQVPIAPRAARLDAHHPDETALSDRYPRCAIAEAVADRRGYDKVALFELGPSLFGGKNDRFRAGICGNGFFGEIIDCVRGVIISFGEFGSLKPETRSQKHKWLQRFYFLGK